AIWARSVSRASRISTRPSDGAETLACARGPRAAKKPPARGVRPRAVQAFPRDGLRGEVVHVHVTQHAASSIISKINCHDRYDQIFFAIMTVQLAHLHTLQSVARHGSFSPAARCVELTPPGVR